MSAAARWARGAGRRVLLALAAGLALSAGCARRGPPSGGPPDLTPPRVVGSEPDSGAAGVPADARPSVSFSEGMEPRSTEEAVTLAPRAEVRQRRWSGRTLTLVPREPLAPGRTYTLIVGTGARDRHGNAMATAVAIPFSTADHFPPGRLEGGLEALGFPAAGTYLWVYRAGREPDSTARDFDAVGVADEAGRFRVGGLEVPGEYRLWGFADLNHNRSFEPGVDVLAAADTTVTLAADVPVARDLALRMVNPRAPGRVRGAVIDSTRDTLGVIRVVATAELDSTRLVMADAGEGNVFELSLPPGTWHLRAFRDDDRNRAWRTDVEPASPRLDVEVPAAGDLRGIKLRLTRLVGGP